MGRVREAKLFSCHLESFSFSIKLFLEFIQLMHHAANLAKKQRRLMKRRRVIKVKLKFDLVFS